MHAWDIIDVPAGIWSLYDWHIGPIRKALTPTSDSLILFSRPCMLCWGSIWSGTVLPSCRLQKIGAPAAKASAIPLLSSKDMTSPTGLSYSTISGTFWLGRDRATRKIFFGWARFLFRYSTTCINCNHNKWTCICILVVGQDFPTSSDRVYCWRSWSAKLKWSFRSLPAKHRTCCPAGIPK